MPKPKTKAKWNPKRLTPRKKPKPRASSGDWVPAFLAALKRMPVIRYACKQAGVTRKMAYDRRGTDDVFAAAWLEAEQDGLDRLEEAGIERAELTSDRMIEFFLKAKRRNVYGDRLEVQGQVTVSHNGDIPYVPPASYAEVEE